MGLIQVGWVIKPNPEPVEFLVNMTDPQAMKVEGVLKNAHEKGLIEEYWMADAIVFPFNQFSKDVLPPAFSFTKVTE